MLSLDVVSKKKIIDIYAMCPGDTGSSEVQCALLTMRISKLTDHFKFNRRDFSSKRGLLVLVGRRRRLLNYIKKQSLDRYFILIGKLGLRK